MDIKDNIKLKIDTLLNQIASESFYRVIKHTDPLWVEIDALQARLDKLENGI